MAKHRFLLPWPELGSTGMDAWPCDCRQYTPVVRAIEPSNRGFFPKSRSSETGLRLRRALCDEPHAFHFTHGCSYFDAVRFEPHRNEGAHGFAATSWG